MSSEGVSAAGVYLEQSMFIMDKTFGRAYMSWIRHFATAYLSWKDVHLGWYGQWTGESCQNPYMGWHFNPG